MALVYDATTRRWVRKESGFIRRHLVYECSSWDEYNWEQWQALAPLTGEVLNSGKKKVYSFPQWGAEVFHRIYSVPQPLAPEKIKPEDQWAVEAHATIGASPGFQDLMRSCRGSRYFSGVATQKFLTEVEARLPSPPQHIENPEKYRQEVLGHKLALRQLQQFLNQASAKLKQAEEKAQQAQQAQESLNQEIEAQPGQEPTPEQAQQLQQAQQAQAQAQAQAQQAQAQVEHLSGIQQGTQTALEASTAAGKAAVAAAQSYAQAVGRVMPGAVEAAAAVAQQSVSEEADRLGAFGFGTGDGAHTPMEGGDLAEKMNLAQQVSTGKLKEIAKLAGRLHLMAAEKQASKAEQSRHEIQDIEQGDDISRVLPSELVRLASPQLRPSFMADLMEKRLLQYCLQGKEPQNRGPIIIALDESGSMSGASEIWSKAVALELLRIATKQKRHCRILHFTGRVERVDDFPPGKVDPQQLLKAISVFFNGGDTKFEPVLDAAIQCIREEGSLKKADIVFITDDSSYIREDWLTTFKETQKELEFRVYGVGIGVHNMDVIGKIADKTISINNLKKDDAIAAVFEI